MAVIVLVGSFLAGAAGAVGDPNVTISRAWGVQTAVFQVPEGRIDVVLPIDLAMGDQFASAVILKATGRNEMTRAIHRAELGRYTLTVGDSESFAADGVLSAAIPVDQAAGSVALILRDPTGQEVAHLTLEALGRAPQAHEAFQFPNLGHVGNPVIISGPFDGDFMTTEVHIGGVEARKLAESPRSLIVESPRGVVGPTELTVSDRGASETAPFRSLRIRLQAPKMALQKGEKSTLTVRAEGFAGLEEEIPLLAINRTPEIITLEGANGGLLKHMVRPGAVGEDGEYSFEFNIVGQRYGNYVVMAAAAIGVSREHVTNITNPPHWTLVTSPDTHTTNISWPPYHAANVTFPPHTTNVTWPAAHLANLTWPEHLTGVTTWHPPTEPVEDETQEEGTASSTSN